ncbi:hypothetical protein AB0E01_00625 [Nocardia vinacea]|uniref:hypothetical protein n=1 Tax=Nocardia vinacea TaxID=96468 RepID=UPI0033CC3577
MRPTPTAIGYLRREVSGISQAWDETHIRSRAKRLGYDLAKTVVFGDATDHPLGRLLTVVLQLDVDAVIVPSAEHFGGTVPEELVQVCDVITTSPENTYARWAIPSPSLPLDGM